MRNIIVLSFLCLFTGCADDMISGGTETDGLNEFCGDRIVNGNEECDEFSEDCSNCVLSRRMFVTSMTVNGLYPPIFEWKCYDIANEAGLYRGLDWAPWYSTSNKPACDLVYQSPFNYKTIDGKLIAKNYQDLIDGSIENPINIDENGNQIDDRVWTGTLLNGKYSNLNCLDWVDEDQEFGTFGWTNSTMQWSNGGQVRCSEQIHMYCIESGNIGINKQPLL